MKQRGQKILSGFLVVAIVFVMSYFSSKANAATVSSFRDTMSTQAKNTAANHVLTWTMVGGSTVASGTTLTIDYADTDFTLNAIANWQTADFAFNDGTARTIVAVSSVSGVDPVCTAGPNNVAVTINTTTNTFKITACSGYTASLANPGITFTIFGTSATGTGTMTNANTDTNSSLVTLTQSNGDTANGADVIETNDVVTVTATVNPVLTFAISSNAVGLGTLSAGSTASSSHTIAVSSNAAGGFAVTYNGPTLTSGSSTIPAYSSQSSSVVGTAGFGINLRANTSPSVGADVITNAGTCGVASDYGTANKFTWIPSVATAVTNVTAPADCVYTVSYVANINTVTPAGAYTSATTYIATGTF